MSEAFALVTLGSGAKSLRCLVRGETFHPKIGPIKEASLLHVEQQRLLQRGQENEKIILWDVGLGAAANAIAAIESLRGCIAEVEIHSFEQSLSSLEFALRHKSAIPYLEKTSAQVEELLLHRHSQVTDKISWHLHLGDFSEKMLDPQIPSPTNIFYDPYSPKTNPDMWTLPHFQKFRSRLDRDCLLTNYSRSTAVRGTLLLAGFYVGIGREIGEKNETTIASTSLSALERPLKKNWLERVKISGNAAPLRSAEYSLNAISVEDLLALESHLQFRV